jgi:hypothetical protein
MCINVSHSVRRDGSRFEMKVKIEKQRVMVRMPVRHIAWLEKRAEENCTSVTAELIRAVNERMESEKAGA